MTLRRIVDTPKWLVEQGGSNVRLRRERSAGLSQELDFETGLPVGCVSFVDWGLVQMSDGPPCYRSVFFLSEEYCRRKCIFA